MDVNEKKFIPRNWKKIGSIYNNSLSQYSYICTICMEGADNFDKAFIASEVSEFWNHIQKEHLDMSFPKISSRHVRYKEGENCQFGADDNNSEIAESEEFIYDMDSLKNPIVTKAHTEPLSCNRSTTNYVSYKLEAEIEINDVNLSDTETVIYDDAPDSRSVDISDNSELHRTDSPFGCGSDQTVDNQSQNESPENEGNTQNCLDDQTVHISDDEDAPESFNHSPQCNIENIDTIELSDDEANDSNCIESNTTCPATKEATGPIFFGQMLVHREAIIEHGKQIHNIPESLTVDDEMIADSYMPAPEASPSNIIDRCNEFLHNYQQHPFGTMQQLEEHRRTHQSMVLESNSIFKCMPCSKYFTTERRLKWHRREVHNSAPDATKCTLCQKIVLTSDMTMHLSIEHNNATNPILTHLLTSVNRSEGTTKQTETNQNGLRPFKCVICGKRTGSARSMIVHHHRFHSPESDSKTTICGICGKRILSRNIRLHVASVHGYLGAFNCKACKLSFKTSRNLQKHMRQFHYEHETMNDDSPSPSSTTSESDLTPEERDYLYQLFTEQCTRSSSSERAINDETSSESLNEDNDDDCMLFGEIIPPTSGIVPVP